MNDLRLRSRAPILGTLLPSAASLPTFKGAWAMDLSAHADVMDAIKAGPKPEDLPRIKARMANGPVWGSDANGMTPEYFDPLFDSYVMPNGIGIINIVGPQFARAFWFLQGYDMHRAAFREMAMRENVTKVIVRIDSPGGDVSGLADMCADLRALRDVKDVIIVIDRMACSAAQAIAAQGTLVVCPEDGTMGHAGVWIEHVDYSEAMAKEGIRPTYYSRGRYKLFFAGDIPKQVETDEVYNLMAGLAYDSLLEMIELGREGKMDKQDIKNTEARLYHGRSDGSLPDVVEVGFADEIGTFDDVMEMVG